MVNMLFWFIIKPTGPEDPVKTIVTSMAAVLTTSMTLRIILSVRGPLDGGGSFGQMKATGSHASRTPQVISARSAVQTHFSVAPQNIDLGNIHAGKPESEWADTKSSVAGSEMKLGVLDPNPGVQITIDQEVGLDRAGYPNVGQTTGSRPSI